MLLRKENTANILFGPTQYGKSSFLDKILDEDTGEHNVVRPTIGSGRGVSATRTSHLYHDTLIGPTIDVPGIHDTGLLVDADVIEEQITLLLAEHGIEHVRFLVFDSLSESSIQIRSSIEQLVQAFGCEAKKAVAIVGSKLDRVDEDELEHRLQSMEDIMGSCEIGHTIVLWKSKNFSSHDWHEQLRDLSVALDKTETVALNNLRTLESRVLDRAVKLHEEQEPVMVEQQIKTTENHVVERFVTEEYEATEWEKVKVADSNMLIDKNVGAGLATYVLSFGIGFAVDAALHGGKPVYEHRPKKIIKQRQVPRFENVERSVTKTMEVPQKKPVKDFMEEARAQILRETREALATRIALRK